jgi:hypothetical membrane protein
MRVPKQSTTLRLAAAVWIAAGVLYLVAEAVAATRVSGYSYARDYISDLGRPDASPLAWWMNAAFRVQGAAFVVAAALAARSYRPRSRRLTFIAAACVYGAGSVVVGLVPSGGPAATVHVAGAAAAIVGGNTALLSAARISRFPRAARLAGAGLGSVGLVAALALVATHAAPGSCERVAVYSIVGWQLLAAVAVLHGSRAKTRSTMGRKNSSGRCSNAASKQFWS